MTVLCENNRIHVIQGDFVISGDERVVLTTILGSCVAACMWEPMAMVGGMNHFLLPDGNSTGNSSSRQHGVHLMELLVNGLMQRGARRDRTQVKLFGGARMIAGLSDIGSHNADFAERFIKAEGFCYQGGSLRGTKARRVQFWPTTGRARQSYVDDLRTEPVHAYKLRPGGHPIGELELF